MTDVGANINISLVFLGSPISIKPAIYGNTFVAFINFNFYFIRYILKFDLNNLYLFLPTHIIKINIICQFLILTSSTLGILKSLIYIFRTI
jgi:hypothetical protein